MGWANAVLSWIELSRELADWWRRRRRDRRFEEQKRQLAVPITQEVSSQ